ncbi:hypothetical protein DFAR_2030004 [Desulfarculales bacterium]
MDSEATHREDRRLSNRLAKAKRRHYACLKDIDYRQMRGMDKSPHHGSGLMPMDCQTLQLAHQQTHRRRQKLSHLRSGPQKACLAGYSVSYKRVSALLREMAAARGDGSYQKMIVASSKTNLEDHYGRGSIIVTAQVPVGQ